MLPVHLRLSFPVQNLCAKSFKSFLRVGFIRKQCTNSFRLFHHENQRVFLLQIADGVTIEVAAVNLMLETLGAVRVGDTDSAAW